jgi:hypothetical protein
MEKSLEFMRYYSTLPRKPSTADVLKLKGHIEQDHEIYLVRNFLPFVKADMNDSDLFLSSFLDPITEDG